MISHYSDIPRISEMVTDYCCKYKSSIWADWENLDQKPEIKKHFFGLETYLGNLRPDDWSLLKSKVIPRFQDYNQGRGWQQAFDVLHEAVAYNLYIEHGATDIKFISEQDYPTPDLACQMNGAGVCCEVKTKNESDNQIQARNAGKATSIQNALTAEYFDQLATTMSCAEKKFAHFDCAKHMFFILNFDDHLHEYLDEYFVQIQNWIGRYAHSYDQCWFWARARFEPRFSNSYELLIVDRKTGPKRYTSALPSIVIPTKCLDQGHNQ
jgi:hypothetical protein